MNKPLKFLVVDDTPDDRTLNAKIVERTFPNAATVEFASGRDALDFLNHNSVDAILTNHRMIEMDGVTLIGEIRKKGIRAPVVMISMDEVVCRRAIAAGADAFVDKWSPVDLPAILRKLVPKAEN